MGVDKGKVERSAKLIREVLKLSRRAEYSKAQLQAFKDLPRQQKGRMWRLAHKWLSLFEFNHMKQMLDELNDETGTL